MQFMDSPPGAPLLAWREEFISPVAGEWVDLPGGGFASTPFYFAGDWPMGFWQDGNKVYARNSQGKWQLRTLRVAYPEDVLELEAALAHSDGSLAVVADPMMVQNLGRIESPGRLTQLSIRTLMPASYGVDWDDLKPLRALEGLQHLDISGRESTDLSELRFFPRLRSLRYFTNDSCVLDLSPLVALDRLTSLCIPLASHGDPGPLCELAARLEVWRIREALNERLLREALHCATRLRSLTIESSQPFDAALLQHCGDLEKLDISLSEVSDYTPLAALSHLERLELEHWSTTSRIATLPESLPLRELAVAILPEKSSAPLGRRFPKLRALTASMTAKQASHELNALPKLETLHLIDTAGLTDLHIVSGVEKLRSLMIRNCKTLEVLEGVGSAPRLERLWLYGCTGLKSLRGIDSCDRLRFLDLDDRGPLEDVEPLRGLKSLQYFGWRSAHGCDLSRFNGLTDLRRLELGVLLPEDDWLSAARLPRVASLTCVTNEREVSPLLHGAEELQFLKLWAEKLETVAGCEPCKELRMLELPDAEALCDVASLGALHKLWHVEIWGAHKLPNFIPADKGQSLRSLLLSSLPWENLDPLKHLVGLQQLEVPNAEHMRDFSALSRLKNLLNLNLAHCYRLEHLNDLRELSKLRSLCLQRCDGLRDIRGLEDLPNLSQLDLSYPNQIENLSVIGECLGLNSLSLHSVDWERPYDLSFLGRLKALVTLDLSEFDSLQGLSVLSELPKLASLNLSNCGQIEDLSPLASLPSISFLNLIGCNRINDLSPLRQMIRRGVQVWVPEVLQPQLEELSA